jgi:plasmid maintenance system antidote protein VapI
MSIKDVKKARKRLGMEPSALFKPASLGTILKGYFDIESTDELDKVKIDITKKRLKKIIDNDSSITIEEAIILSEKYKTSVQFWIGLDLSYQVYKRNI